MPEVRPVVAIVQARMGSSRLPGKVLRQVAGRSLLAHLLQRLRKASTLDAIVVATTEEPGDDVLVAECARLGVPCFRGSETDVLGRFHGAAQVAAAATIVRVTADCPLMDPAEVDRVVGAFLGAGNLDYVTNQLPDRRKIPLGLAVEVFSRAALARAYGEATQPHQREHVTPYLYDSPGRFRIQLADVAEDLSHLRITVDTPEDLAVVAPVLEHLEGRADAFALAAAVQFLNAHPEIAALNASVVQKGFREAAQALLLLLRADATLAGGTGHVTRLLGLGEAWIRRGGKALLVSIGLPATFRQRFEERGMAVHDLPPDIVPGSVQDAEITSELARSRQARLLLADGYAFSPDYLASLRNPAWKVAYVDDFGDPELDLDAVLMPNAGATPPPGHRTPVVLAGARFTPVRQDFREVTVQVRTFEHRPLRLLMTFGGSDPARLSIRALPAALGVAQEVPLEVTLLLGPTHPDAERIRALAAGATGVQILHDVKDMAALLGQTDLALSAGGTTCWELAILGVPMALVQVADNQTVVLRGIAEAGAGILLPPVNKLTDQALVEGLRAFVTTPPDRLAAMSQAGRQLIDGLGATRIVDALAQMVSGG